MTGKDVQAPEGQNFHDGFPGQGGSPIHLSSVLVRRYGLDGTRPVLQGFFPSILSGLSGIVLPGDLGTARLRDPSVPGERALHRLSGRKPERSGRRGRAGNERWCQRANTTFCPNTPTRERLDCRFTPIPPRETLLNRLALFARVLLPSPVTQSDCTVPSQWGNFVRTGAGHV